MRDAVRKLIALRKREIFPWLDGKSERHSDVLNDHALCAMWRRDDGRALHVCANFGKDDTSAPRVRGSLLYATSDAAAAAIGEGRILPASLVAWLG